MTQPEQQYERGVVTFALGGTLYVSMAFTLARSFRRWHHNGEIAFAIIANGNLTVPEDLAWIKIIPAPEDARCHKFCSKLWLDYVAIAKQTLFIDADCIICGSLANVFDQFSSHAFTTLGASVTEGEFFGAIQKRLAHLGRKSLPIFVGAMYFVQVTNNKSPVLEKARALLPDYDALGYVRLAGHPNEEPLISSAMALLGVLPVFDEEIVRLDAMDVEGRLFVNSAKGVVFADSVRERPWHPAAKGRLTKTRVVHFNASFAELPVYKREALFLLLSARYRFLPEFAIRAIAHSAYMPLAISLSLRSLLRPAYRRLFGTRAVRSARRF